jgi:hypothetical protein
MYWHNITILAEAVIIAKRAPQGEISSSWELPLTMGYGVPASFRPPLTLTPMAPQKAPNPNPKAKEYDFTLKCPYNADDPVGGNTLKVYATPSLWGMSARISFMIWDSFLA